MEAPGLYSTVWMSPLLCLAHAASVTSRIRLATGLLIPPYYHPVTLAREIQTLWQLSGGRFVLGVGPGWDQHEFETLGMTALGARPADRRDGRGAAPPPDRARRELRRPLLPVRARDDRALLPRFPELWVGGGSKIQTSLSPDKPYIAPAVLARIAGADGWLARAAGNQQMVKDDVRAIRDHLARNGRIRTRSVRSPELRPPGRHHRPRGGAPAAAPGLRAGDGHAPDVREPPAVVLSRDHARRSSSESVIWRLPASRIWSWPPATTTSSSSSDSRARSSDNSGGSDQHRYRRGAPVDGPLSSQMGASSIWEPVGEHRLERGEGSSCEAAPEARARGVVALR